MADGRDIMQVHCRAPAGQEWPDAPDYQRHLARHSADARDVTENGTHLAIWKKEKIQIGGRYLGKRQDVDSPLVLDDNAFRSAPFDAAAG
jgi:hypothetical protein